MGPAKDKHGVRESFTEVQFYFAKNEWPFPVEKKLDQLPHIFGHTDILSHIYGILSEHIF